MYTHPLALNYPRPCLTSAATVDNDSSAALLALKHYRVLNAKANEDYARCECAGLQRSSSSTVTRAALWLRFQRGRRILGVELKKASCLSPMCSRHVVFQGS